MRMCWFCLFAVLLTAAEALISIPLVGRAVQCPPQRLTNKIRFISVSLRSAMMEGNTTSSNKDPIESEPYDGARIDFNVKERISGNLDKTFLNERSLFDVQSSRRGSDQIRQSEVVLCISFVCNVSSEYLL